MWARSVFGACVCALLVSVSFAHAYESPGPAQGFVNDFADVLLPETEAQVEGVLRAFAASSTSEIAVAMVQGLRGESLEYYAATLFAEWGVGKKRQDNGVLLLAAIDDRAVRIEVGYGLEGALPDSVADRIIRNDIVPFFKEGRYDDGVVAGVEAIRKTIQGEYAEVRSYPSNVRDVGAFVDAMVWVVFLLVALLEWLVAIFARSSSWWLGGVCGFVGGALVSVLFLLGIQWGVLMTAGLTLFGLLLDFLVSRAYTHAQLGVGTPPWWAGGSSGGWSGRSSGGGFGGFGGGMSGGASGRW